MRISLLGFGLSAMAVALLASGCNGVKSCTAVGCSDNFGASVQNGDGTLPSGMHRIEILTDRATFDCEFTFPTAMPSLTSTKNCAAGMTVSVGPEYACTDTTTQDTVVHKCDPIPGRFIEQIRIQGAPGQVHIWQYVDEVPILDAAVAPAYTEVSPNGPECGPTCRGASVSWTLQ